MAASGAAIESATKNIAEHLYDEKDRINAKCVLTDLRIQHDQPMGFRCMTVNVRPNVLKYLRMHNIQAKPTRNGTAQIIV